MKTTCTPKFGYVGPYLYWKPLVQFANYQAICEKNYDTSFQVSNPNIEVAKTLKNVMVI
jgi:hypothetical protein